MEMSLLLAYVYIYIYDVVVLCHTLPIFTGLGWCLIIRAKEMCRNAAHLEASSY